jgi:hypothetical protein
MIMIDFADLHNGKILLHADDVVVAASADVNYLAAVIQRQGGIYPSMILSSSFDFPEEYGFEGDPVALLDEAVALAEFSAPPNPVTAYMVIDEQGYRWYYDTKVEMLESIRLGNVTATEYYELCGTVKLIGTVTGKEEKSRYK